MLTTAHIAAAESVTVRPGDTLWSLAQHHDTTVDALMSLNGLGSAALVPGTELALPGGAVVSPTTWTVAVGDTLYDIATATGTTVDDLVAWNALEGAMIRPGQELKLAAGEDAPAALTIEVGPGDSLWRIARAYDTTTAAIAAANGIAETATLQLGTVLTVPGRYASATDSDQGGYAAPTITVDPGDTLWHIARRYDTTVAALMAANHLSGEELRAGQRLNIVGGAELRAGAAMPTPAPSPAPTPREVPAPAPAPVMVWPVDGPLTSHFGWRRLRIGGSNMHYGIDIDADTGDPVVAATAGTVTFTGWMGGFGQLVVIEQDGAEYYYAHTSELLVRQGQVVEAGQLIARVGTTGRVTGSHLHFEVRVDGSPVDPLPLLERHAAAR